MRTMRISSRSRKQAGSRFGLSWNGTGSVASEALIMKVTIPTYHECFYEIHVCCLRGTEMSCRDIKTLLSGLLQSPEDSVPRPWAGPGNSGINHQN